MPLDIIPRNFLSFPSFPFSELWKEDDDWLTTPASYGGLNIYEDDKKVYVEVPVPGIEPKEIEITTQDGYLWVRGETKEEESKTKKYYRKSSRSFSYRVAVPGEIDTSCDPEATYKHGVMTVAYAKAKKVEPKKVQIKNLD